MTRTAAISGDRRRPEDHPDSVLPDDDTVRDEESTPLDHTVNDSVESSDRDPERSAGGVAPRRRSR